MSSVVDPGNRNRRMRMKMNLRMRTTTLRMIGSRGWFVVVGEEKMIDRRPRAGLGDIVGSC